MAFLISKIIKWYLTNFTKCSMQFLIHSNREINVCRQRKPIGSTLTGAKQLAIPIWPHRRSFITRNITCLLSFPLISKQYVFLAPNSTTNTLLLFCFALIYSGRVASHPLFVKCGAKKFFG